MRLIPGKTKVSFELFKGVRISDMIIAAISLVILVFLITSNLPGKYIAALIFLVIVALLLFRMDGEPNYNYVLHIIRHLGYKRTYAKTLGTAGGKAANVLDVTSFTGIKEGFIEYGSYYGAVIEIPPIEFRFFSAGRRKNSIENSLGRLLRTVNSEYACNIIKIERPIIYDRYIENENKKIAVLKDSYEKGFLTEDELQARIEIIYDRIERLKTICFDKKVIEPFYYIVLFDSDKKQLSNSVATAKDLLITGEMTPHVLNDKEIAVFLRYTYHIDFDEREIENVDPADYVQWASPENIVLKARTTEVNSIVTHNFRVINYPSVVGDAWMAGLMSIPGTKVVIKAKPMDRSKAMRRIDLSLQELRGRLATTGIDSRKIELQNHIATLSELLKLLQGDNETLLECNIYVTAYDIVTTNNTPSITNKPEKSMLSNITSMKKVIRRMFSEAGFKLNNNEFSQMEAFIGGQVSGYDPLHSDGRGIPSNSLAASFPWIYSHVADKNGVNIGSSDGVPVFVDFFRRDSERVNSNMVIVGKSGSGKSYATKSLLSNLAADDTKIFVLDPENEYTELATNLHGKFINVGNAQYGRLNPFQVITTLDDDETGESNSDSYSTHLQFLEEFFRQILPDCEKDALEYLNSLIDRMYMNAGISPNSDFSKLKPEDYPVFDNLYDVILEEFQSTDSEYIRSMLRTLINYTSKFSSGGRNSSIWNGPSTVTTEENFTVFNFQSLLANRNGVIANAQMFLVLKYIDNEIIKNREYNKKYNLKRKIIVVIDEAHVFIDSKYPIALDFMFQLAKRIRKYNGMQIVITQNIKDFVGSEELARKSTAIINACQYSFIFSLSPNDMDDLCKLYEKAGGINENEQEQIVNAGRGQAFTVLSPQSRAGIKIEVPENVHRIFHDEKFVSNRFSDEEGQKKWAEFMGDSTAKRMELKTEKGSVEDAEDNEEKRSGGISFIEITQEDLDKENEEAEDTNNAIKKAKDISLNRSGSRAAKTTSSSQLESVVEKLSELTDNIGKLSYEGLLYEMRRIIKQESGAEITDIEEFRKPEIAAPVSVPVSAPAASAEEPAEKNIHASEKEIAKAEEKPAESVKKESDDPFELFDIEAALNELAGRESAETKAEEVKEEQSKATEKAESFEIDTDEPDDDTFSFDITAFLSEVADNVDSVSPIDMMEANGQNVIVITLEELVQYNSKKV